MKRAFTLAETLITIGIIGIVAALTLPALNQAINKKVRAEQIRTVKYKFTKATEEMASQGLIGNYENTDAFVDELQKHLKIMKRCNASHLRECWAYDKIMTKNGEIDVATLTDGTKFMMNPTSQKNFSSPNVGIITADGTSIILSYNKKCEPLDPTKQYGWSTSDGKPVTNATSNCVAAIFEINGNSKPNTYKKDVIAFNSNGLNGECAVGFGVNNKCFSAPFSPTPISKAECEKLVSEGELGIKWCYYDNDYWAGAVKQCGGVNKVPSMDDLALIATELYDGHPETSALHDLQNVTYTSGTATELGLPEPGFDLWAREERSNNNARGRRFNTNSSYWHYGDYRNYNWYLAICLAD